MKSERIRKKCILICFCAILLILILVIGIRGSKEEQEEGTSITVAEASRLLSYISEESFSEIFYGEEYVTISQGREVYTKLGGTPISYPVKRKGDRKPLTQEEWMELYLICVDKLGLKEKITEENCTIIGVVQGEEELVYTEKGKFFCEGINISKEQYRSNTYLKYEDMLIYKLAESEEEVSLKNIWIQKYENNTLQIYIEDTMVEVTNIELNETPAEIVADITFGKGKITNIALKKDLIHGKVLAVKEQGIEIEAYGLVEFDENFTIYKTYGTLSKGSKRDLVVGYDLAEFVVGNGKLCSALIRKTPDMQNIRVLLKSSGFQELFHDKVTMEVTENTIIKYGEQEEMISKGETLELTSESPWFDKGRVHISPENSTGRVIFKSIERDCGSTGYRGNFEISKVDGRLLVVNELLLEEYLYDVVPSEMPSSYGTEALKAQAVCARSYAYNQILYNGYAQYGAHVDDSVSYQVYHNVSSTEETIRAVKETCGQVAMYEDRVIDAYYYSASCGVTTDAGIWDSAEENPYIVSHTVNGANEYLDLTSEEKFSAFIKNKSFDAYDNDISWFRWVTRVSLDQLKRNIDTKMMGRYEVNPKNILTKNEDGEFVSVPVDTVGKVKSIHITKRGKGGVATEMIIKGSKNTVKVLTEYNIRVFLAPVNTDLKRQDGSIVDSLSMLPSAYTTALPVVDEEDANVVVAYEMAGGGYGHGAGMSQNGAKTMASQGMSHEEILKFYYQGIELKKLY